MLKGKIKKVVIVLLVIIGALALGVGIAYYQNREPIITSTALNPDIKKKIDFIPYDSVKGSSLSVPENFHYDSTKNVLSFSATIDNTYVRFDQIEGTKSSETKVKEFKDYLNTLNTRESFDSSNGKVYIAYPSSLNGSQMGLIDGGDSVLLVYPKVSLTTEQWKTLTNSLVLAKK